MADLSQLGALRHAMTAAQQEQKKQAPQPSEAEPAKQKLDAQGRAYATGKRKNAVARVWLRPGSGKIEVNGREIDGAVAAGAAHDDEGLVHHHAQHRPREIDGAVLRMMMNQPFVVANRMGQYDVVCTVVG